MNLRFPLSAYLIVFSIAAQQPADIETVYPGAIAKVSDETVASYGAPDIAVATGLQQSLGVNSWYSADPSVPGTFIDHIVVTGVASGGIGGIRHFTRPATSSVAYSLSSTVDGLPMMPAGIEYDSVTSCLYIIDKNTKIVHKAMWDGQSALSGLTWSSWFSAASFFEASNLAVPALELLPGVGREVGAPMARSQAATELRISPVATAWSHVYGVPAFAVVDIATQQGATPAPPVDNGDIFLLDAMSFRDGATSVRIHVGWGHINSYVLSRMDSGQVLGVATQGAGDSDLLIPSAVPLVVGVVYGVHRVGAEADVHRQRCMVRYGVPGELTGFGAIEVGRLQLGGPLQGGKPLHLSCPMVAHAQTPVLVFSVITFGGRDVLGADPVVLVGPNQYLISTLNLFPLHLRLVEGTLDSWMVFDEVPMPQTPETVGHVFLFQAIAVDPVVGIYFSDILGGLVLAP